MVKKVLVVMLVLTTFLLLTSCGLEERFLLDEDLYNQIKLFYGEDDNPSHIIYRDKKYIFVRETDLISVDTYDAKVLVGWNGYRYGYVDMYYSYTAENPLFIYYKTWIFLSEDYNYSTDTFVIENTFAEIIWEDIFTAEYSEIEFVDPIKVVIYSKKCSQIKSCIEVKLIDGKWYVSVPKSQKVWTASDEFIKILSDNGII